MNPCEPFRESCSLFVGGVVGVQVLSREHSGVGVVDHVCDAVTSLEGFQDGDEGGRFCLVALGIGKLQWLFRYQVALKDPCTLW